MRISDWSSDVCSSDLDIGGQARKGVGRPATAQEGKISAVKLRLIRSQRRKQAGVRQRFQIGAYRRGIERRIIAGPAPARKMREIGAQRIAILASEGKPARSEEHTSELQSLLSISYAVFCSTTL